MKNSALSEKALYLDHLRTGEGNLFAFFLFASLSTHFVFFFMQNFEMFKPQTDPVQVEELEIEASLVTDFDFDGATETAIPDAKESDKTAIRDNLLPQLTKKFSILDEKVDESAEAIVEEAKPKDGNADKAEENLKVVSEKDEVNRLKKMDALKRLALEKLRHEKKDKQTQADKNDPLARIKEELTKKKSKLIAGGDLGSKKSVDRYRKLLQKAVRRNYALPEAYNFKNAELNVVIAVKVSERGELASTLIAKSSGDQVFDELAFSAVKKSAPLPHPPQGQAGRVIHLKFSPKSF